MKKINTYILEKLTFKKGMSTGVKYNKGDKLCFITLKQPGNYRREGCPVEVSIHFPMTFDNYDDHKISYYTDDNRKLEHNYTKINKYEFIEDNSNNWETTIILNKESAISFLKELYKSTKRVTLTTLKDKYFEDISKLDFKYWNNEIRYFTTIGHSAVNLNRNVINELIDAYEKDR